MATQASTLSEALEIHNDRYQSALSSNSKRDIERLRSNINQINSYYDIINAALGENNNTRAQAALDEIVSILSAEGISVSDPVTNALSVGFYSSPAIITVPVDEFGANPDYTNANSSMFVIQAGTLATSLYTFSIATEQNVTASILNDNEVHITALTADQGNVVVNAARTGYDTLSYRIDVYRYYDAQDGISINPYPSTILVPSDANGANPVLTNAISTQIVRDGINDETSLYTFSIQGVTNVTASIQNLDEVKIDTITADEGNVIVRATRSGYPTIDYNIPVQKQKQGNDGVSGGTIQNVNLSIQPLDEGTVLGNARGASAFDGQTSRTSATQVASGDFTIQPGGINNTTSSDYGGSYGSYHNAISFGSSSIGIGGSSSTAAEIILSGSESAVQKSLFFLEGRTTATGGYLLETLKRSSIVGAIVQSVQVASDTAFIGTLEIFGFLTNNSGGLYRLKFAFSYWCDSAGVVTVKQLIQLTDYSNSGEGVSTTVSINTPSLNEYQVRISPAPAAADINWGCIIEGMVTDI